jgi:hypothetical protein
LETDYGHAKDGKRPFDDLRIDLIVSSMHGYNDQSSLIQDLDPFFVALKLDQVQ